MGSKAFRAALYPAILKAQWVNASDYYRYKTNLDKY